MVAIGSYSEIFKERKKERKEILTVNTDAFFGEREDTQAGTPSGKSSPSTMPWSEKINGGTLQGHLKKIIGLGFECINISVLNLIFLFY
jgi:hypothetical protein